MLKFKDIISNDDLQETLRTRNEQANDIIHHTWASRIKDGLNLKSRALNNGY